MHISCNVGISGLIPSLFNRASNSESDARPALNGSVNNISMINSWPMKALITNPALSTDTVR